MKQKLSGLFERISRRFTVWRVNRALNIRLTDWQIAKIFDDTPFPEDVREVRCNGKTTAQILFVLLCPKLKQSPSWKFLYGFPPDLTIDSIPEDSAFLNYEALRVAFFFGEDGVVFSRRAAFVRKAMEIKRKLNCANIKTHEVRYTYHRRKYIL